MHVVNRFLLFAKIALVIAVNCFFFVFIGDAIHALYLCEDTLLDVTYMAHLCEPIAQPSTWRLLTYIVQAILVVYCIATVLLPRKLWIMLFVETLVVNLFLLYLLFIFIIHYIELFGCL